MLSKNRDIDPPPLILPEVLMKDFWGRINVLQTDNIFALAIEVSSSWLASKCIVCISAHFKNCSAFCFYHTQWTSHCLQYIAIIFITWISENIWIRFLRAMFNWSPQFYTHLFRSLFELLLILWQFLLLKQLVPNYRLKVKLQLRTHPKISSEIIPAWENGSQSHHIGQSLYLQIS